MIDGEEFCKTEFKGDKVLLKCGDKEVIVSKSEFMSKVKPHPMCVIRKVLEGYALEEAKRKCIEELKIHGVSEMVFVYKKLMGG